MSRYKIFETDQFISDIEMLQKQNKAQIEKKLLAYVYPQLSENPHFGLNIKKLKNYKPETWRYRIGDYRVFYEIDETEMIISILSFDLRRDVY